MFVRQYVLRLLLLSAFAIPLSAQAAPQYGALTVLAGPGSVATGINNAGQVVGQFLTSGNEQHAFVHSGTALADLGTLGGPSSYARGINDAGQVVGVSDTGTDATRAFLYSGGAMRDLGTLGGVHSYAAAINNAGKVVGGASTADTFEGILPNAFVYSGGAMQNLGTFPAGDSSNALGLNNVGQIVGNSAISTDDPPEHPFHAFLYSGGVMTDLGTLGGIFSSAAAINDRGQVVGYASTPEFRVDHAFLYSSGVMMDLGTLGGGTFSEANDINNLGQVVGWSDSTFGSHAFLYQGSGQLVDLNGLIDPASGWTLTGAGGINEHQQIAVTGCKADQCYALRLDMAAAVPESQTYGMLLAGLGLLGVMARRRPVRSTGGEPAMTNGRPC
jgi:probable HAF family extracellular repeat protein